MFKFIPPDIEWLSILPIVIVCFTGLLALLFEMINPRKSNREIVGVSLAGLVVAAFFALQAVGMPASTTMAGMMTRDQFGVVVELLLLVTTFLAILFSEGYLREKGIPFGEFYPLMLWSAMGAMVMATTTNLLVIFIGLEILSISLYVLAGLSRSEEKSEESALKYFLLGAFASGFLLYGMAFVYGAIGSLNLSDVYSTWIHQPQSHGILLLGLGLMLIGLSFKSAFVPFHQWTPDVYQGAPTNVTAFMAAGSKIGAIAALWRVLDGMMPLKEYWMPVLFWIAILTMCVGNLIALTQKDVKRILGYSSIAHAGYILVGILAAFQMGHAPVPTTTLYYLFSYTLMTVGAFAVVTLVARKGNETTELSDLHGLWQRSPLAAAALVVFVASLIGVPPTAGFFGKFMIFSDALNAGLTPLAIVLAVNSAVSVYYYLGIARAAFVSEHEGVARPAVMSNGLKATCALCMFGVIAIAIFFTPLVQMIGK